MRQQYAADKQRGEALKAELQQQLEVLRSHDQQQREEFEALQTEVDQIQEKNEEKACLRASLEMATAEEVRVQQRELSALSSAYTLARERRESTAAAEAEAASAACLTETQLLEAGARVKDLEEQLQLLSSQRGQLSAATTEELARAEAEYALRAATAEERREAALEAERARRERAEEALERLRKAVREELGEA